MVRSELIKRIAAERPHLPSRDVEAAVDKIFEAIIASLARGQRVEIRGFGVFEVRPRVAFTGRNPKTGIAVSIPQKSVPWFKGSNLLYGRLNRKN
ncbi:HU family DNA-binding protein [Paracoccus marcusii]|uniref:HU family DNA-binding protein n=1 Tax=Paracoccus marcusii TaxID=59779 RepID=UPI00249095D6|nr:HU family DNA-binding protein [Paracoccus marcusii]